MPGLSNRVILAVVATSLALTPPAMAIEGCSEKAASAEKPRGSCLQIVVKASPAIVYQSILALRHENDDTVKEVSRSHNECVLEESFPDLPLVGHAVCVYKEVYTPNERIEYKMIKSDKFKAFEGKWQITPMENGTKTKLSLSSYVDVPLPLPFAKQIAAVQTKRGVKERLDAVKKASEAIQQVSMLKKQPESM
ncbi:MAG: SRPBCC family protein [Cyanobacteria bacterium]|nr:SRPBCC family protein [Cyanobacteriota bacterium]